MKKTEDRKYHQQNAIVFQKNEDEFGQLSNMASGFPVCINGIQIRTIEALYQSCRFPLHPEAQREVIEQKSPMGAKYKSRSLRQLTRTDWEEVKVNVMRWCLRVKLAQHWEKFSSFLILTGDKPIVEQSKVDSFWGAKPFPDGTLIGSNVLGRLLMELRESIKNDPDQFNSVALLVISYFLLYDETIQTVDRKNMSTDAKPESEIIQSPRLFD
jgi:ribA/ribD-fused uncharacterized protein